MGGMVGIKTRWLRAVFCLMAVAGLICLAGGVRVAWLFTAEAEAQAPRGGLGAFRGALAAYESKYGKPPRDPWDVAPEFMKTVPKLKLPGRPASKKIETYGPEACIPDMKQAGGTPGLRKEVLRNTAHWGYVSDPGGPCDGFLFIDSTGPEKRTEPYYTY